MKLVASVRLLPTPEQAASLRETLERCNAACEWLARIGADARMTRQFDLHKIGYAEMRARFGLAAQAAVRCISKTADAFKVGDRREARSFRPLAAQPFDGRIFRFLPSSPQGTIPRRTETFAGRSDVAERRQGRDAVSIWTVAGRQVIPFVCSEHQRVILARAKGQVDLAFVRGKWLLAATCDADEGAFTGADDALGVDLGIVNLAVASNGRSYSGKQVEDVRRRREARRRALQKVGTRSAKRALRRQSGKQARFQRTTNHTIAKAIVADAERGRCLVAMEDLRGIRDRVQVKRHQRARMANWGFAELRGLVTYKTALRGVPLVFVDPRSTSRGCAACGLVDERNRPDRDTFKCIGCGLAGCPDHNAALNIRKRGLRARSIVMALQGATASVGTEGSNRQSRRKPSALADGPSPHRLRARAD